MDPVTAVTSISNFKFNNHMTFNPHIYIVGRSCSLSDINNLILEKGSSSTFSAEANTNIITEHKKIKDTFLKREYRAGPKSTGDKIIQCLHNSLSKKINDTL